MTSFEEVSLDGSPGEKVAFVASSGVLCVFMCSHMELAVLLKLMLCLEVAAQFEVYGQQQWPRPLLLQVGRLRCQVT